jgi:hypothetical protein
MYNGCNKQDNRNQIEEKIRNYYQLYAVKAITLRRVCYKQHTAHSSSHCLLPLIASDSKSTLSSGPNIGTNGLRELL